MEKPIKQIRDENRKGGLSKRFSRGNNLGNEIGLYILKCKKHY